MDWSILLSLICPIMMLFCMKGMFGGHNHNNAKNGSNHSPVCPEDIQSLNTKIAQLEEQNSYLVKEIENLKETATASKSTIQ